MFNDVQFKLTPILIISVVVICAIAASKNYKISINADGFQFEPARVSMKSK